MMQKDEQTGNSFPLSLRSSCFCPLDFHIPFDIINNSNNHMKMNWGPKKVHMYNIALIVYARITKPITSNRLKSHYAWMVRQLLENMQTLTNAQWQAVVEAAAEASALVAKSYIFHWERYFCNYVKTSQVMKDRYCRQNVNRVWIFT